MGVYRPTVTRKGKRGQRVRTKSTVWWGLFRHPVTGKQVRMSLKTQDRKAAELAYSEAIRRAHIESAGLLNPYEEHMSRPLSDHLIDWHDSMVAKSTSPKQATQQRSRANAIIEARQFKRWQDISASLVQSAIKDLIDKGRSLQTANHYLASCKQFTRWMVRDRRAPDDPLKHLPRYNVQTDKRHERRALTDVELQTLLQVTRNAPHRFRMTGPQRAMLYRFAVETGLRANEIRSLSVGSLSLTSTPPTVTVAAAYSKHRREDVQPIRREFADVLRKFVATRPKGDLLFELPYPTGVSRMIKKDLEAAEIPYRDSANRVADFHALRHTFITNIAKPGVHPKDAQLLARHGSIGLTMDRYCHRVVLDAANALDALPSLDSERDEIGLAATGTDDFNPCEQGCCTNVARTGHDGGCRTVTDHDASQDISQDIPEENESAQVASAQSVNDDECRDMSFGGNRRRRDSNPRNGYPFNGFQNRRLQPLGHSSGFSFRRWLRLRRNVAEVRSGYV